MAEKKHSNGQTYGSLNRPNNPVTKVTPKSGPIKTTGKGAKRPGK